jgi:hypothetical protein
LSISARKIDNLWREDVRFGGYLRWAVQLPVPPPALYVPDIELPDTVPEYVIAVDPTVPNEILEPFTCPLTGTVPAVDRSIVPLSVEAFCVQVRWKVPLNAPLYEPFHVPDSPDVLDEPAAEEAGAAADDDGAAAVVAGGVVSGGDEPPEPDFELLQPLSTTTRATATDRFRIAGPLHRRWNTAIVLPAVDVDKVSAQWITKPIRS